MGRLIMLLMLAILLSGCQPTPEVITAVPPAVPLPSSLKGYELYSWQQGDAWIFTLITGTNRAKTRSEIMEEAPLINENGWVKIRVNGQSDLQTVLAQLPAGEQIIWGTHWPGEDRFTLPPPIIRGELVAFCQTHGLELLVP